MTRINSKFCFIAFGLLQLHLVTSQTVAPTETPAPPPVSAAAPVAAAQVAGKDQSTIVWAVSTDPLDPALSGVGPGGQGEGNAPVIIAAATTQVTVAMVTTPAYFRQETTAEVVTSAPIVPEAAPSRAPPTPQRGAPLDPSANIKTDVTDTVMALLNETGYSGSANDANVQEIVAMLMNGSVPTDADLIRLGFIPQPVPMLTTPPPYSIPGNQPPLDTSITFPNNNLPIGGQTGPSSGLSAGSPGGGFSNVGFPTFPVNPPVGAQTGSQGPPQTGIGAGSTDPFAGAFSQPGNSAGVPNFLSMLGPPATSPRPTLGDPFSINAINAGSAAQLPNLGPIDPNALGPKPNLGTVGSLGTPGSTTDMLGSLGPMGGLPPGLGGLPPSMGGQPNGMGGLPTGLGGLPNGLGGLPNGMGGLPNGMGGLPNGMGGLPPGMGGLPPGFGGLSSGMGGLPPSPQTGILDAPPPRPQRNQGGNMMNNPMMMMMMMNPEMMDMMLSGENPMLTYMFMQQMNKRPQRPRPTPTTGMGPLGGFPGGSAGLGGLPMSPLGAGSGGLLDPMNPLSAAGPPGMGLPGSPMDLSALSGLGAGVGPTPGAPVNPMDLMQGSLTSSAGPGVPPLDLLPFPGMSPGMGPSMGPGMPGQFPGAPITDPFAATVG